MNMSKIKNFKQIVLMAVMILSVATLALAQTESARISGTVTDSAGAIIAGATVTHPAEEAPHELNASAWMV